MAIYLDHNATTPIDRRVWESMLPYLQEHYGNPSSVYRRGRLARQAVETAREQVAHLVNAHPSQVVFTSGGTEANNMALYGCGWAESLAVSKVEHASVLEPAKRLEKQGRVFQLIDVDKAGRVTEEGLKQALSFRPQLLSVMMANNETGVIQNIPRLSELARASGAVFHTDAVQAAGKLELDFQALGVHMMTLSGHKIYGPKGVGALIVDRRLELSPVMLGGGQERGMRSGTENVAAIVGFGVAAELALQNLEMRQKHAQQLSNKLEDALSQMGGIVVFAKEAERLANTVFFAIPGIDGEMLLMSLDKQGIEVSSGSACDSQKSGPSHVLMAMGIEESLARCAVRVSIGRDNTEADIDVLIAALKQQVEALQSASMLAWA